MKWRNTSLGWVCAASLSILLVGGVYAGQTYYVSTTGSNTNAGLSVSNTWRTIQHAVQNVGPGDVITVLPGNYAGARIEGGGTPEAPITLRADTGGPVVLDQQNPLGNSMHNSILWFEFWDVAPVSNWVVEGFEIVNSPRDGIDIRGTPGFPARNIVLRNNHVHHCAKRAIFTAHADDMVIENNECAHSGQEHGIYCSNSGDRPIIRGNHSHHNSGSGIHLNGDASAGADGIISDAIIEDNVIHDNSTGGGVGSGINCDGVENSTIINNLVYANNDAQGIALFKIDAAVGSRGNLVANNTILRPNSGSGVWAINISHPTCVSNRLFNNIILNDDAVDGSVNIVDLNMPGFESDYNVVVDRFSDDEGATTMSLPQWQALGYDQHSIIATPAELFRDAGGHDYHLPQTSPAVDTGTNLVAVITDLEGVYRPYGPHHDIGAYEWHIKGLNLILTQSRETP